MVLQIISLLFSFKIRYGDESLNMCHHWQFIKVIMEDFGSVAFCNFLFQNLHDHDNKVNQC